jgi:hypothetical protein
MTSSQIIGNHLGTAVPVAVDASGNVQVSVSGPVSANLYADDGSGTVPVAGRVTGEMLVQALGTTSGGVVTPLLVDSQGRVVTSGGVTGPTGPAGQSSTFYPYRTNTTPGTGDPGTGLVSWNATNQLAATQIQINHIDQNNVDIDIFLALLSVGDTVTIQDRSNSANFQRWTVSGTPVPQTGYVQVPVTLDAGSWSAPNNHQIIVAFLNAGPVGPTGPVGPAGATGATGATGTAAWPSTSSVLLAGDGTAVTVGSGLTLAAGTLTAATVFDCDFTLLANQSLTTATVLTDQSGRSLTFTPNFAGTASANVVSGSGIGLTAASIGGRAKLFSAFNGFGRLPFFGKGYRIWLRWANYTPIDATQKQYVGLYIEPSANAGAYLCGSWRVSSGGTYPYVGWYSNYFPDGDWTTGSSDSNNVQVLEQSSGMITAMYGFSSASTGFPGDASLKTLGSGRSRSIPNGNWFNVDNSAYGFAFSFGNEFDSVSRTMYCTNLKVETWD